ncbi:MAG: GNAT family N-acetyltransferase, partial [Verrucomicrobiae bacterium]|nr:GNAT family N-acetyltransferase [Verrucomicrobiae bacterium]
VFEPYSQLEDLESWLAQTILEWEDHPGVMYVLFDRENPNQILGSFSIRMEGFRAEIGYLVAKPYWGKGYMTEVMQHWVDWALEQPGLFRVGALCDVDNPASARVMEKVGMEREGILRRYSVHPNLGPEPRDVFCYAKTR